MALRAEFSKVTPQLRAAITGLAVPPGLYMTSLVSGPHVANSAHFAGRAVDISLPRTSTGWQFAITAITSGRFARVGSVPEIVENPDMQALAKRYGVTLFLDDASTGATGDHLHLEVAP